MKIIKSLLVILLMINLVACQKETKAITNLEQPSFDNALIVEGMVEDAYSIDEKIIEVGNKFSFSYWLLVDDIDNNASIISLKDDNNTYEFIGFNNDNGLTLLKDGEVIISSEEYLQPEIYNQLVLTYDNGIFKVYLNAKVILETNIDKMQGMQLVINDEGIDGQIEKINVYENILNENEIIDDYEYMLPYVYLYDLKFNDMDNVKEDFWLYPELIIDEKTYPITWTSNNEDVIKPYRNHGVITFPEVSTDVILHASVVVNDITYEHDYKFRVNAKDDIQSLLQEDVDYLVNEMGYIANNGQSLITMGKNGSNISYEIVEGSAYIQDGILYKDSQEEKSMIKLSATLTLGEYSQQITFDLCLLDEYVGYIMSYFINNDSEDEKGALAYSYDGLNWTALDNYLLSSDIGSTRIRDPYIGRDKDGNFIILATEGFDNPNIYIWKSNDLIEMNEHSLVKVAYPNEHLKLTGQRAWAPEFTYVPKEDCYYVYFSDPLDEDSGSIYFVKTKDFINFSYPKSLLNVGYPIIDGTIICVDGINYMFYKDEREGAKTIFYARSNDLTLGFGKAYDNRFIFEQKEIEGPFVFKNIHGDNYYLYVDNYPNQKFYVASFNNLGENADFNWLSEEEYQLPSEQTRHGSVIPVTQKELDRILDNYS